MTGFYSDALYYPHMRLENSTWIRSQLLYFDKIRTISPLNVDDEPTGRDESELLDNNLIIRHSPTSTVGAVESASRFAAMLLAMSRSGGLFSHFSGNPIYDTASNNALNNLHQLRKDNIGNSIRKLSPRIRELEEEFRDIISDRYVRMHPDKLQWKLKDFLKSTDGADRDTNFDSWVNVDPLFASIYMTVLARTIAAKEGISCTTDEAVHDALFQDVTATLRFDQLQRNRRAEGILVDVVMSTIKIDPSTSVSRIVKFRDRHSGELERFRSLIYGIASRCSLMDSHEHMRSEAKLIYEREIKPCVRDLEDSLSGFGILWTRSGLIKAATVLLGISGGLATFDYSGNSYLAVSAMFGIGLAGFALSGWGERQAATEASPHAYLLDLKR